MVSFIKFEGVHFGYEEGSVLEDITLQIHKGEFWGILGPNGSGKTTLLKLMAGVLKPKTGGAFIEERSISSYVRKELAKQIGVLPQDSTVDFSFSCFEVVLMGRAPYLGFFQTPSKNDYQLVYEAMEKTHCLEFSRRDIRTLSGGERERVMLARAIVSRPQLLLLDEPTTFLDLKHQSLTVRLLSDLHQRWGLTLVAVLHDINLAAHVCQKVILLSEKRIFAQGDVLEVLTVDNISKVFDTQVMMHRTPEAMRPYFFSYS